MSVPSVTPFIPPAPPPPPVVLERGAEPERIRRGAADAAPPSPDPSPPNPEMLRPEERVDLVAEMNPRLAAVSLRLQIQVDEQTGTPVIRLVDTDSGDVLRQIPDEAKLKLSQMLMERLQGHLIDNTL